MIVELRQYKCFSTDQNILLNDLQAYLQLTWPHMPSTNYAFICLNQIICNETRRTPWRRARVTLNTHKHMWPWCNIRKSHGGNASPIKFKFIQGIDTIFCQMAWSKAKELVLLFHENAGIKVKRVDEANISYHIPKLSIHFHSTRETTIRQQNSWYTTLWNKHHTAALHYPKTGTNLPLLRNPITQRLILRPIIRNITIPKLLPILLQFTQPRLPWSSTLPHTPLKP